MDEYMGGLVNEQMDEYVVAWVVAWEWIHKSEWAMSNWVYA